MRRMLLLLATTSLIACQAGDIGSEGAEPGDDFKSNPGAPGSGEGSGPGGDEGTEGEGGSVGSGTWGSRGAGETGSREGQGGSDQGTFEIGAGGSEGETGAGETGAGETGASSGGGGFVKGDGVELYLERTAPGQGRVSFGVPLPKGAVFDAKDVRVLAGGELVAGAAVRETLAHYDAKGARTSAAALVVQLPSGVLTDAGLDVEVLFSAPELPAHQGSITAFASPEISTASPAKARTAERTIELVGGAYALVEKAVSERTLFVGREPRALAQFPAGYLAKTGIFGSVATAGEAKQAGLAGMSFLSDALGAFAKSARYEEAYALNPHAESVIDPIKDYSGWLYDRCATFLTAHVHFGDAPSLRHAFRSCAYFADKVQLSGPNKGIFTGKPDPDTKYSHLRGLYAYYALTGDEAALDAGKAIAEMWLNEPLFVQPYRQGHTRGPDKLWTERLLAASLEGIHYGFMLTGDKAYLSGFDEMLGTAYAHITGGAAELASVNPGHAFPPQNCFVHSGEQHADAGPEDPWCSPWMSELVVEPLLAHQALTNDPRVDEIFVRLGRFLRDVGTSYFSGDPLDDSFLEPSVCDDPAAGQGRRRLVPLYGAGIGTDGQRRTFGEWSDFEHCADATALTAAALRALVRRGEFDKNPVGPFESEGASMLALHHELASCAARTFEEQVRPRRDPSTWTAGELAAGAANPGAFIDDNRIGFPRHVMNPQRKISWWFNTSMLQFGLLKDANISIPALQPGQVKGPGCP